MVQTADVPTPEEASIRSQPTVYILELIKDAQQQHGLRHGDYQRYRGYCSRRIRRVRKSLHIVNVYKHKGQQTKKPVFEEVTDSRYIQILVFEAERCWAYAMQLKQEVVADPRKRFRLNRKLKKAVRHAATMESTCRQSKIFDAVTKLEAQSYHAYMKGCLEFECQHWPQAIESFTTLKTIYGKLSAVTESKKMACLYQQRCQEVVPQLRYCAFNIGDESALSELMEMRMKIIEEQENPLLSDLDRLLTECRQKQTVVEMETIWCGRKVVLEKPAQAKRFCLILQQFPEQVASMNNLQTKISMYEKLLMDCRDAIQAVRDDAKNENLNVRSLVEEGEENFSNAQLVYLYLVYIRLVKTIELYWLMIQDVKQKGAKAQDLVRLFDSILQTFSELQSLPVLVQDQELLAQMSQQILHVRAYRCFHVAQVLASQRKWRESLALYERTLLYIEQIGTAARPEGNSFIELALDDDPGALRHQTTAAKLRVLANCISGEERSPEGIISHPETSEKPVAEDLETFRRYDPSTVVKAMDKIELIRLPPDYEPIACKPVFFDLAFEHLQFPSLDQKLADFEAASPEQKGGIRGFVKGWLWGSKS